jgi:hypothetical protein
MNSFAFALAVVLASLSGVGFGWRTAHETVSIECDRLGGFYIDGKTYTCEVKK